MSLMKIFLSLTLCIGIVFSASIADSAIANPIEDESKKSEYVYSVLGIQECDEKLEMLFDIVSNFVSKDEKTALHYAVSKGNEKMVDYLIKHGANTNARDGDGQTPIFDIPPGGEHLVKLLNKNGANASVTNINGSSVLDLAIVNGNDELVDTLLKNGAISVSVQTFFTAVSLNEDTFVDKIIQHGFNVNETDEKGQTALHIAAASGSEKVIDLLLDHGVDVNVTDSSGANALHKAAVNNKSSMAEILIVKGIDINEKDLNGHTPLHRGIEHESADVIKVLILNKARLHIPDNNGSTPLAFAKSIGHSQMFSSVLKKLGEDIDSEQDIICALVEAISNGTDDQVNNILYNKVGNVNNVCLDLNGITPLIKAAEIGRLHIVDNLINRGADVNLADPNGVTPLFAAVINGHKEISNTLIACGANLGLRDKYGCTALMRAAQYNREDIAILLLENGASKYDTDSSDKTAAKWANDRGFVELGYLIKNWKPNSSAPEMLKSKYNRARKHVDGE